MVEVAVLVGHKVLVEINNNSALIVGDPEGILGEQLRPHLIHCLNIFILVNYFIITFT
jgi:hypothetical protein